MSDFALLDIFIHNKPIATLAHLPGDKNLLTFNQEYIDNLQPITEVGSGLNGHRPKLIKLLTNSTFKIILVEHRDRLMQFGAEYVEAALAAQGRRLIVADPAGLKDDLVQDMIEVLTSFCARLYGRRPAKNKAIKALESIKDES